jgi:hypothetical protein
MGGRPLPSILLLSAALATVTACEVAVDPIAVSPGCPEMPLRGPEAMADVPIDRLIDDFEDMDTFLAPVGGRNGMWDSQSNLSSNMLTVHASTSCAARGKWAGHFVAAGFTRHGASVTAFFKAQIANTAPAVPYDGSDYSGISFWAATGSGQEPFPAIVGLSTLDTVINGGVCSVCYDFYGTTVPLTHTWQRFVLPYSSLAQGTTPEFNGVPQLPLRKEALVGLLIWPDTTQFDIWIDDVRFEP